MKKYLFFTLLLFTYGINFSQQKLESYSGIYENGKASYTYYENSNQDRFYHGNFSYTTPLFTYTGEFKDNLRTGLWNVTIKNKKYKIEKNNSLLSNSISGKYKEGKMDSIWNFTSSIKLMNPKTKKYNPKPTTISANANFKNNTFYGKINYKDLEKSLTGSFTENGVPDGIWSIKYKKQVEELKYENGVLISRILKDIATGDKIINENNLEFVQSFWKNYDKETKLSSVNGKIYFVDTVIFENFATQIFQNEILEIEKIGKIQNPLYQFKRGLSNPNSKQIILVECKDNNSCLAIYLNKKKEEEELAKKKIEEENEKIRIENLALLEQSKILAIQDSIKKIELLEQQKIQKIKEIEQSGDEFAANKKYQDAIKKYEEILSQSKNDAIEKKYKACILEKHKIDSLHILRDSIFKQVEINHKQIFDNSYSFGQTANFRKNIYKTNYLKCIEFMQTNFSKEFEETSTFYKTESLASKNDWSESDELFLKQLENLSLKLNTVNQFTSSLKEGILSNDKDKMRILNSTLNWNTMIYDVIHYKPLEPILVK